MLPAHRSKGYGSRLIEALRAKARDCGCTRFVFRNVRADNAGAIRLYESMGARAAEQPGGLYDYVLSPP